MKKGILTSIRIMTACMICALFFSISPFSASAATAEAPSQAEAQYRGRVFNNGWNNLYGNFYYQGASYGFVVNFYYNTSTGKVTNATYRATDYGTKAAKSKITSMTISYDEDVINISGKMLRINVSATGYGEYSGSMTRGNHSGRCSMYR